MPQVFTFSHTCFLALHQIKVHSLGHSWGGHVGVVLEAAARPSGQDRAFQTASLGLDALASLSYPEPATLQDLDIRSVTQAPRRTLGSRKGSRDPGRRGDAPTDARQTELGSSWDLIHARARVLSAASHCQRCF